MPPHAQQRAIAWLKSFHFTRHDLPSLHTDNDGGILYVCQMAPATDPEKTAPSPPTAAASVPVTPFPSSLIFHSRPGAPNILYINFTGETVTNTQWNTDISRTSIPAVAFSSDSDLTTFNDTEQAAIKRIWQRVAEDYAPFNIDVTTERPGTLGNRVAMALVTRNTDADGNPNPYNTAGGVAYVNVFGTSTYAKYRPAWIYHDNLGHVESLIAEGVAHEVGHNLGLSHDGRTDGLEYYGGHGTDDISWGPIMGTGYYRNVSQWSRGEYYLANNTQDDLATIAGKITYRSDDHGNTAGTATALILSASTNIVSTTPENDPANTNTTNKGILERNTDVDVFSFITGTGPIRLAVNPWISPSGTRGGNLDILLELYHENGTLLATNNPPAQTTALIETNLTQGRYFLHVKNTPAGDPFNATPTGYTIYGSIGQYFISGYVSASTTYVAPPVAELSVTNLTQPNQTNHVFTITYSDDTAIEVATIDSNDIRVTGPNGYDQLARFISVNSSADGTPRTATYAVSPPAGGVWMPAHNGTYTVLMRTNQVRDVQGAFVPAGPLGQFQVALANALYAASMDTDPGWTLEPDWQYGTPTYTSGGPTSGFTGTKIIGYKLNGTYPNNLPIKYATTPPINTTGSTALTLRFRRWLGLRTGDTALIQASRDGTNWLTVWFTTSAISDSTWQLVQYALPATVVGSPSLRLRWGLSSLGRGQSPTAIGWNLDDVEILGDGAMDTTPPQPALSVASLTMAGSPSHSCSVTYTDATAVRLSTLDSTDLLVTGPNGYSNLVEFIGADLPLDGSPITASYSIPAPGGAWDAADNGAYAVTLQDQAVADTLNNFTPQTALGTFIVSIPTNTPGHLAVIPTEGLIAFGVVGGPFSPGSFTYTLTNTGGSSLSWTAAKGQDWVSLSAVNGTLAAGAFATLTVSFNTNAQSLPPGDFNDTVSFLNITSGEGNTTRSVSLAITAPGQLEVTPLNGMSSTGPRGGPFTPSSVVYTLTNSGGASLDWRATTDQPWLSLSATNGQLAAGSSLAVTASLNSGAASLPAGNYTGLITFTNIAGNDGNIARPVVLEVQAPGILQVSPADDLIASGPVGGPFAPASKAYTLTNAGGLALNWTAVSTQPWITLSATGGALAAHASTNILVSINTHANTLPAGAFSDTVIFTDPNVPTTSHPRAVQLSVVSIAITLLKDGVAGDAVVTLQALPYQTYVIEASSNLVQWTPGHTNTTSPDGRILWRDSQAGPLPQRFYRGRAWQP